MAWVIYFAIWYSVWSMPHLFHNAKNANSSNWQLCHETSDFCLTPIHSRHDGSSHCEGFSLWYILISILEQVGDSVEPIQISLTPTTGFYFRLGQFWEHLETRCNFVYSNSDPFFPTVWLCQLCDGFVAGTRIFIHPFQQISAHGSQGCA